MVMMMMFMMVVMMMMMICRRRRAPIWRRRGRRLLSGTPPMSRLVRCGRWEMSVRWGRREGWNTP